MNKLVLEILKDAGLLKGRVLALDASTMDANAAMRSIVRKDTEESYADYVQGLAKVAGEQAPDRATQASFDKNREGRTTSNTDWTSVTDPEAKITRTKDRRTHLRGRENNKKRYLVQVSAFNMGLVMRRPCGFGAPRGLTALCPVL